jgi:hypothetical protein
VVKFTETARDGEGSGLVHTSGIRGALWQIDGCSDVGEGEARESAAGAWRYTTE